MHHWHTTHTRRRNKRAKSCGGPTETWILATRQEHAYGRVYCTSQVVSQYYHLSSTQSFDQTVRGRLREAYFCAVPKALPRMFFWRSSYFVLSHPRCDKSHFGRPRTCRFPKTFKIWNVQSINLLIINFLMFDKRILEFVTPTTFHFSHLQSLKLPTPEIIKSSNFLFLKLWSLLTPTFLQFGLPRLPTSPIFKFPTVWVGQGFRVFVQKIGLSRRHPRFVGKIWVEPTD